MSVTQDRILDALDDAPQAEIFDRDGGVRSGQFASVKWLASRLNLSDSAIRSSADELYSRGLVSIHDAIDTRIHRRRWFVTAEAAAGRAKKLRDK
jgi:DNA-binding MarR family transcriptional regulator